MLTVNKMGMETQRRAEVKKRKQKTHLPESPKFYCLPRIQKTQKHKQLQPWYVGFVPIESWCVH